MINVPDYTFEINFDVSAAIKVNKNNPAAKTFGGSSRVRMNGSFTGPGQWWPLVKPDLLLPASGIFHITGNTCTLADLNNKPIATLKDFSYDVISGAIEIDPVYASLQAKSWGLVPGKQGKWTTLSHEYGHRADAEVFVDDAKVNVLDRFGNKIYRPSALDPHDVLKEARAAAKAWIPGAQESWDESNFRRGGAWDAQRLGGGKFHDEYIDYATILIGIYFAGAGRPRAECLKTQNDIAGSGQYAAWIKKDPTYTSLPLRNVANTDIGYGLVNTARLKG